MNARSALPSKNDPQIVYVKPVLVADLPEDLREQIGQVDTVYSVNRPDGERLALVLDRNLAFLIARQNDYQALSVH